MANILGAANISFIASCTQGTVTILCFLLPFVADISAARRHMSSALLASPDNAATFTSQFTIQQLIKKHNKTTFYVKYQV